MAVLVETEADMRALAAAMVRKWQAGDLVLLEGPLGAGKTTFVRGMAEAMGYREPVRSPTFNLLQTFPTDPPMMHADLYRVKSYQGIGLEDYLDTHLCVIEWPDRAEGLVDPATTWRIRIDFEREGRRVTIESPLGLKTEEATRTRTSDL